MNNNDFKNKYLKYKAKYLDLKSNAKVGTGKKQQKISLWSLNELLNLDIDNQWVKDWSKKL